MNIRELASPMLWAFAIALVLAPIPAEAQPIEVSHAAGLLTVRCMDAPLGQVFERIGREAGVELIVEDDIKSKRLSADLADVPVAMAVQRLLEGAGVNYAVMMSPTDWGRVDKVFVGAGGGGPAAGAAPPPPQRTMRPPRMDANQPQEGVEEFEEALDQMDDFDPSMENPADLEAPQAPAEAFPTDPGAAEAPPSYLPEAPVFPRSRFTPGLPGNRGGRQQRQPPSNPGTSPQPFPYLDPFGRPIPVPPGEDPNNPNPEDPNQQPEQRQRRQQ